MESMRNHTLVGIKVAKSTVLGLTETLVEMNDALCKAKGKSLCPLAAGYLTRLRAWRMVLGEDMELLCKLLEDMTKTKE